MSEPSSSRRVTIKDIARELGLHPSTVSRALHHHPRIREQTRQRVLAKARELGFREDPALKSLISYRWNDRTRALRALALILETRDRSRYHVGEWEAIDRAAETAHRLGYRLEHFHLCDYPSPRALTDVLYHRGIEGVMIGRTAGRYETATFFRDWNHFAVVGVDAGVTAFPCHNVLSNHFKAILLLMDTLERTAADLRVGALLRKDLSWRVHRQEIGAFLCGQTTRTRSRRLPICFHDPREEPRRVADWIRTHRPDVVIARHADMLDPLIAAGFPVPDRFGFAALELNREEDDIAGFRYSKSSYAEAVIQVDTLLRNGRFGIPENRHVLLIDPTWHPGATLPGVERLRF